MAITFGTLKTSLARDLSDPDSATFSDAMLGDLVNAGLAEVGRIAPDMFQEDITVLTDTLQYALLSTEFTIPQRDIEVSRVEVWDQTTIPMAFVARLRPASTEYVNQSDTGWKVWNGTLYLTNAMEAALTVGTHVIRVWGYAPYPEMLDDLNDSVELSTMLETAVREFGVMKGYQRLQNSRALFQQWQTASSNTDVSYGQMLSSASTARSEWERRRRQLYEYRELP